MATVVGMVEDGMAEDEIVSEFPQLSLDDIREALRYAAAAVDERELPLGPAGLAMAAKAGPVTADEQPRWSSSATGGRPPNF